MDEINIRKAKLEDAAVVHELLTDLESALGATSRVKRTLGDLQKHGFSDRPCFEALIAWRDDAAVGLAVYFREFSTWKGSPGVYIQDLYVSTDLRGSGLGSELMQAVFDQARGWGARYCKLSVQAGNEGALAFYERLGFKEVENEHVLLLDGL